MTGETISRNQLGELGRAGEDAAAAWLKENGYEIIGRNIRVGRTDIDIICKSGSSLAFVEVKSRSYSDAGRFGGPASAVTYKKQRTLTAAARSWLAANPHSGYYPRMDVIEVLFYGSAGETDKIKINHIRNAFTAK